MGGDRRARICPPFTGYPREHDGTRLAWNCSSTREGVRVRWNDAARAYSPLGMCACYAAVAQWVWLLMAVVILSYCACIPCLPFRSSI
ncbi:MAG: hypothetical protein EOO65_03900 [Methanosarcinales archaeon]|nr:MAG: hypothetical protein EOO65_03900 [Methanosarcinales archaeon]